MMVVMGVAWILAGFLSYSSNPDTTGGVHGIWLDVNN